MFKQTWKWDEGDMVYKLMKRLFFELGGIFENSLFWPYETEFSEKEGYRCVIGGIGSYYTYFYKIIHQLEIGGGVGVLFRKSDKSLRLYGLPRI